MGFGLSPWDLRLGLRSIFGSLWFSLRSLGFVSKASAPGPFLHCLLRNGVRTNNTLLGQSNEVVAQNLVRNIGFHVSKLNVLQANDVHDAVDHPGQVAAKRNRAVDKVHVSIL